MSVSVISCSRNVVRTELKSEITNNFRDLSAVLFLRHKITNLNMFNLFYVDRPIKSLKKVQEKDRIYFLQTVTTREERERVRTIKMSYFYQNIVCLYSVDRK